MKKFDEFELACSANCSPVRDIARKLELAEADLEYYGRYKAKVSARLLERLQDRDNGKLILVTAVNPTPAGEGKTTTTVGLGQAFSLLRKRCIVAIREPSLGPLFGVKGGATGGGCSQVLPIEDINLHFTGDIHAVGAANNLLAAAIDNHIFQGNDLRIQPETVIWKRVVDMNDRALRRIEISPSGKLKDGTYRTGFEITAASEVMAILCLAIDYEDLRKKLSRIVIGFDTDDNPVTAAQLKVNGAMAALLREAFNPNLVQTYENTPAFVHGGPFANIAHGCSSLIATKLALKLSPYVITEAGFGADLGAEKFFDITCPAGNLNPDAVVLVATVRALKMHGGISIAALEKEDVAAVERGLENLEAHVRNLKKYRLPVLVVINHFIGDSGKEIDAIRMRCRCEDVPITVSGVRDMCGAGGVEAARAIIEVMDDINPRFTPLYPAEMTVKEKIEKIATEIYGADGVDFTENAQMDLLRITHHNFDALPVCIAKTPLSLSDNPRLQGRPKGFRVTVRGLRVSAGAGFVVAYMGNVMTMPGLPKEPAAGDIDIDSEGAIIGLL
jgi:formate--tetrahydrofolate ligase